MFFVKHTLAAALVAAGLAGSFAAQAQTSALPAQRAQAMVNRPQYGATQQVIFKVGALKEIIAKHGLEDEDELDFVFATYDFEGARAYAEKNGFAPADVQGRTTLLVRARNVLKTRHETAAVSNVLKTRHDTIRTTAASAPQPLRTPSAMDATASAAPVMQATSATKRMAASSEVLYEVGNPSPPRQPSAAE